LNRWNIDERGQVDGDAAPMPVAFPSSGAGGGLTPWHLWGNTQTVETLVQDSGAAVRTTTPGQLVRIAYKRPETWHWLFVAKLLEGPPGTVTEFVQVEVQFDLIVGVGRAAALLQSLRSGFQDKAFESFFFTWGNGPAITFPRGVQLYTTQVLAPNRIYRTNAPGPDQDGNPVPGTGGQAASVIDKIVAQDLQANCRVVALAPTGAAAIGQRVVVEVQALFAPAAHVRPDWFADGPPDVQYPGAETGGR
jgi:hypothetical protein